MTAAIEDCYPLTPMQQGMLFNYLLSGSGSADVMQVICSLEHQLDAVVFERAWRGLVTRHPVLRTAFRWEGLEEPLQEVWNQAALEFRVLDWRDTPGSLHLEELQEFLEADLACGFDLAAAPLMRVTLIRLGEAQWKCVWTRHHIILDGNSYRVIFTELFELYDALRESRPPQLDQVRPFKEHVEWLTSRDWKLGETFWRERLGEHSSPNQLRPPLHSDDGDVVRGRRELSLSKSETAALKRFAMEHRISVNAILIGAWALLLSRYTGDDDVVFGTTRACRMSSEYDATSTVGLLINTVPFATRVSKHSSVAEWLRSIVEEWMRVAEFEHTPLPVIKTLMKVAEARSLFDTFVVFNGRSLTEVLQAKGGDWTRRDFVIRGQASFPVGVTASLGSELQIGIGYERRSLDDGTAERMLEQLRTVMLHFVENPGLPPTKVDILTDAERRLMLVEWNATDVEYERSGNIPELIECQVDRSSAKTALVCGDQTLSYAELDARANRLAQYLRARGVEPETMVGILLRHSIELVVATLAVMKAGGACLLLEPELPGNRLAFILRDSGVRFVITDPTSSVNMDQEDRHVVCLETLAAEIAAQSDARLGLHVSGEGLAFAVYTSGSTGRPKAALNSHRGLSNVVLAFWHNHVLTEDDVLLHKAPLSFDAAHAEMFLPLVGGARLVIANHDRRHDLEYLTKLMSEQRVTCVKFVPSILRRWLREPAVDDRLAIRLVLSGGEQLTWDLYDAFRSKLDVRLFNEYGPAEVAIVCFIHEVDGVRMGSSVPIGRPLPNNRAYIVDRYFNPLPVGVPGELCIGGVQVGGGYLHRTDLTAERFIADPFSNDPSDRLYRTGDIARFLPDGSVEFLGRVDNQIKIRGVRIELEEVEAKVREHPDVEEAVAASYRAQDGDLALAVYYTVCGDRGIASDEIRELLRRDLPTSMMPAIIQQRESLPQSNSQKIDRTQLRPADSAPAPDSPKPCAPRNDLEARVLREWIDVLGTEIEDVHQDFFAIGGHSLLATKIINRLNSDLGASISLREFFAHPTVAAMAEHLGRQTWVL